MSFATAIDATLEAAVVPSFTRIGYHLRSRLEDWDDLEPEALSDKTVIITGGTSGLGRAAAVQIAAHGATVVIGGRNRSRTVAAAAEIAAESGVGTDRVQTIIGDTGDLDRVRAMATELTTRFPVIDVLIHNAGALSTERKTTDAGHEATVASQVLGPFLLTHLLLASLSTASPGRVVTVSSGGMYTEPLRVDTLEMDAADYNGTKQYARAKRAQVTLNQMLAERHDRKNVVFHAMHPGWSDTPGVTASLPTFRKVVGPLLRTPDEGADTMIWLAAADEAVESSGGFWHDRGERSIHKLGSTRRSDTDERRAELWAWCVAQTGVGA